MLDCANFGITTIRAKKIGAVNTIRITKKGNLKGYNTDYYGFKKSLEKFKMFIGFKNMVCTNLCLSTDGFSNEISCRFHPKGSS